MIIGKLIVLWINQKLMISEFVSNVIMFDEGKETVKHLKLVNRDLSLVNLESKSDIIQLNKLKGKTLMNNQPNIIVQTQTTKVHLKLSELIFCKSRLNTFRYN